MNAVSIVKMLDGWVVADYVSHQIYKDGLSSKEEAVEFCKNHGLALVSAGSQGRS